MIRDYGDCQIDEHEINDCKNIHNTRSTKNTCHYNYNCLGYATNVYLWLCPYDNEQECEFYFDYPILNGVTYDEALLVTKEWILEYFGDSIREVNGVEDLHDDEYLIAYKCGYDGKDYLIDGFEFYEDDEIGYDFHAMKRLPNGQWWHKCGARRCVRVSEKVALADVWFDKYFSKTVFFAKKI